MYPCNKKWCVGEKECMCLKRSKKVGGGKGGKNSNESIKGDIRTYRETKTDRRKYMRKKKVFVKVCVGPEREKERER